jgi:SAM-dependent methyltransferase
LADHLTTSLGFVESSPSYARWLYDTVKPYVRGDVLEVGSGLGTYSQFLFTELPGKLCLTDINEDYLEELRKKFPESRVIVERLDLGSREDFKTLRGLKSYYDTIVCMNVLEHVKDDVTALREMSSLLKSEGVLVLLVPVHKSLYNSIDKAVGHYRRYSKPELIWKLRSTGYLIQTIFYFDVFGIIGWCVNGNLLKKPTVNREAFSFFDKLVPILRVVEGMRPFRVTGISLVAVCMNSGPRSG